MNRFSAGVIVCTLASVCIRGTTAEPQRSARHQEGSEEWFKSLPADRQMGFITRQIEKSPPNIVYGLVVDTEGKPVAGVDVTLSWFRVDDYFGKPRAPREEHAASDSSGRFMFACKGASSGYFRSLIKDGYEVSDETGGSVALFGGNKIWTKDSPAVITLRKKGPLTFLIVSPNAGHLPVDLFRVTGTNAASRPLDLLAWESDRKWRNSATANADLRIDAAFDVDRKCWNVTYSVTNGPGGIVLSDGMLYEAPESGYGRSVSVTVTNVYGWNCFLYVKSRTPAVYSRVLFAHTASTGTNPALRVSCKAWVNPCGDRSLEHDERVGENWRVRKALVDESKKAIRSGRLPSKPDIARWIKETNERVAREEAESDRRHKEWVEQQKKSKGEKTE